jgi:hypothetical protein
VNSESGLLSYAILVRLREWNGQQVELSSRDFMTDGARPKLKLSPAAKKWLLQVKNLVTGDRDFLRGEFEDNEPGIDLEVDVECQHCGLEYMARLDVAQESFFFPQATSRRSKRRRSS